jgi:hypothetical protein
MNLGDYPAGTFLLLGTGSYAPTSGLQDVPAVTAGVN